MSEGSTIEHQSDIWDQVADEVQFTLPVALDGLPLELRPDAKILDYGCGYGRLSRLLSELGYSNIVGYDTSEKMIARGNAESPDLDLRLSASGLVPGPEDQFDAAIVCGVLTSLPAESSREVLIQELRRVLKPNGMLLISEFATDERRDYDEHGCFMSNFGVKMKHFRESELRSMFCDWEILGVSNSMSASLSGTNIPAIHIRARSAL